MQILANGKNQWIDQNGAPLVNGSVYFYAPGTTNPLPTYQDQAGTIANTNPIELDSRGQAIVWGSGTFRQVVQDVNGILIWDQVVTSAVSAADLSGSNGASLVGFNGTTLAAMFSLNLNLVVDSIAALRATSKVVFGRTFVTGYYAPHDGGGGAYQYDPNDSASADNGGTIIVASDGGRWKLQSLGSVTDMQFGAKVDGVTDDTAATQRWVNWLQTSLQVGIPAPGKRKISAAITVTSKVTITAPRRSVTYLLATQNQNGFVVGDGTTATQAAVTNTLIEGLGFNPFPGVAAFTSGACVYRNTVASVDVVGCDFFGGDAGVRKLWFGLLDYQVAESDAPYCTFQMLLADAINVSGSGGGNGRSVDCNYDNCRFINISGNGIYWGPYTAGMGAFRPEMYRIDTWGISINSPVSGGGGQNYFITDPDIEMDGAGQGIIVSSGQSALIHGGWIGVGTSTVSQPKAVWFGASASSCELSARIAAGCVVVDGPANSIIGGEVSGDASTTQVGIQVNAGASDTLIGGGVRIRQFTVAPISFVGNPARCLVDGAALRSNGGDIAGIGSYGTGQLPPTIDAIDTDAPFGVTAASTLPIVHGRGFVQVSGSTAINAMNTLTQGTRVTIQAAAGGITINNGTIILKGGANLAVPAFNIIEFITDGHTWFELSRNF